MKPPDFKTAWLDDEELLRSGLTAAELALAWIHNPDDANEFDRVAEEFTRDTGFTRPGKDKPPGLNESFDMARGAWGEWCKKRSREVRAELTAFVAKAKGEK